MYDLDTINDNIIRIVEAINNLNENVTQLSESIKAFRDECDEAKIIAHKATKDCSKCDLNSTVNGFNNFGYNKEEQ